jgi:hypothetical protein
MCSILVSVSNTNLSRVHAGLSDIVTPAAALVERDDLLPTPAALRPLLPDSGLRRGSTINVSGAGATSLAFALLAEAIAEGGWCAAVGVDTLGLLAAHHAGLDLSRLVLVPEPGPDWPTIVAALLDAFEIVVLGFPGRTGTRLQRRLVARVRDRGRVLVSLGGDELPHMPPDVRLVGTTAVWEGLGWGFGHLRSRQLQIRAEGRRLSGRTRHATVWLPDADGQITADSSGGRSHDVLVEASA